MSISKNDVNLQTVSRIEIKNTHPNRPDTDAQADVAQAINERNFDVGVVDERLNVAYVMVKVETSTDVIEARLTVSKPREIYSDEKFTTTIVRGGKL